ncbi:MAG: hypothetical protein J6Q36_04020 [Alistipes sp.]|nr:hypothetical protein [Alistipes sp.]
MKKLMMAVAAFGMLLTSCQNDLDFTPTTGETATVSFAVGTPDLATRAYSDGTTATVLQYAVYNAAGEELTDLTVTDATINGSAKVELQLTTGNTYSVIFWAAAEGAPYTVDFGAKTMTVNYTGAVSNDEARDAFYKYHEFTVKGAQTETIELRRPFAQLNIGTADYAASTSAGYTPTQSAVTVKNVYSTLDLVGGIVSNEVAAEFALADIKKDETFPVAGYEYLAMNYLLVASDKETVEVEFTYTDGTNEKTRTVGSVPVQRNYRTNIYGNLLTSDVDINVVIEPEYNEPDYSLYNVVVDEVSYTDFAEAVAKAMELNKPVEFIQNVAIDADETITVPAGKELTLNLNGYTLSGVSDQTGSNRNMFDVRGTMTVNGANTLTRAAAEGNGCITIKHVGDNMGWGASTNVFNVTAGGVLNIKNVHAINFGGSDMGFVAHLNNWGEVTLNVENSTLESNYVAVRVFNSGPDMNNVTIKNSTLKGGSYAFWVHNYTEADFGSKDKAEAQKELLNFNIFNGTNIFIGKNDTPVRFGFTNSVYADENGSVEIAEGVRTLVSDPNTILVYDVDPTAADAAAGLAWIAENVKAYDGFKGYTVKLVEDIDLTASNWDPIGDNREEKYAAFSGIFDGNNKTITGAHITGDHCFNGAVYGSKEGWGLFSVLDGATVKDLKVDGAIFASYTVISGTIAGYANNTTFENIDITNTKIAGYNWYTGGVVGWAQGECTFKGINLDDTVSVGTLWDSHGQNAGGIAGGVSSTSKITIEDCNIACVMDVINDVTSNYKWYIYRVSGMIIGNTNTTETKYNEVVTATATNVTCKNVTVTYGDWMNYHYCEGYWNRGWGRYESSDYVGGVDQNEPHNHADGESHYVCIPFDQLFGGSSNGSGHYPVKGLAEFPGVTVNYPASYRREVSTAAALTEALGKGVSVILDKDIDFGSTQLAITGENQVVDLGGHALTTANNWGGISLKNGATIKNGTITHAGNTAAIKAFNGSSVENVTINATCATADKTVTGIAVQQGANVESIKNVTINGVSQGIEVGYQATVGLIENAVVNESNNGTAKGIGLVINGGKVGKAKDCTFKGETYGITLHLKGVFAAGLELENCTVEGTTASIYAWDEKGISNTSGSLVLTYDAATTLTGPFVWDFEDECQSVVTLNKPQ